MWKYENVKNVEIKELIYHIFTLNKLKRALNAFGALSKK